MRAVVQEDGASLHHGSSIKGLPKPLEHDSNVVPENLREAFKWVPIISLLSLTTDEETSSLEVGMFLAMSANFIDI